MKSRLIYFSIFMILYGCVAHKPGINDLKKWLEESRVEGKQYPDEKIFSEMRLSADEAREAAGLLMEYRNFLIRNKAERIWKDRIIISDSLKMPFLYRVFGDKPADGRSLYISMHGGGNAPAELNNQQWRNQIMLYQPREGVYVAPRAPWDDWNMWFKPGLDGCFDELIQAAVAVMNVNPDKVYLMGYSAGGDGVYRLAPRMADRWAAASMMAGHPGESSALNLRNVPFMIWMGESDNAYNRNTLAAERGRVLDTLRINEPEGYVHQTHIIQGKGHWMDRADTTAITWMSEFHRNSIPQKVVWRQEDVVLPSLYWLSAPISEARSGALVVAEYKENTIDISACDYSKLTIGLNDDMMNLDKPVTVKYRGKVVFHGKVERKLGTLLKNLDERGDIRYMFPTEIEVKI